MCSGKRRFTATGRCGGRGKRNILTRQRSGCGGLCAGAGKYPYLLAGKEIMYPNQAWATDITHIKLGKGHVYLTAVIDLYSRKALAWEVFNSLDAIQYARFLEDTILKYGIPSIFNTDQGTQFTSDVFIAVLEKYGIRISMDGKNRALDNIYIERLWRTVKYEDIYLKKYESVIDLQRGLKRYFEFYNNKRFHQALDYSTPSDLYESFQNGNLEAKKIAA
jgi:putative transposase